MTRWTPSTSFATNSTATGTTPSDRKPPFAAIVPEQALSENVFISERLTVGIDVGVPAGHVKERGHFLDVVRNDQGVRLTRRLECVVARRSDPVVLEVAPPSAQREGMHRSGMAV